MPEQELRGNFIKKLTKLLYDLDINIYIPGTDKIFATFGLAKEDIEHIADRLIAAEIGDVSEYKKHRVFIEKIPVISNAELFVIPEEAPQIIQLYGAEEVENIVKERDEYKQRIRLAERALFRACGSSQRMLVFLQQAEKELQDEKKDE